MKFTVDSRFLTHEDLDPAADTVVTIKGHGKELIGRGAESSEKFVVYFRELKKGLVLNVTNGKVLTKCFGDEMDLWTGKKISLYVKPDVEFGGEIVSAIRIRFTLPSTPKAPEPQSLDEFITEINMARSRAQLWNFVTKMTKLRLPEEDRDMLQKSIFQRMEEVPETSVSQTA